LSISPLLASLLPSTVDPMLTFCNISGAFLEGAFIQVEKHYVRFQNPPVLVVFRGGFIAMYTSLAGVTQHGAELQMHGPYTGITYVVTMLLIGLVANIFGGFFIETVMLIYRQGKPYKKNERGVKTIDLAATIYDDLIFNLVYLFVGVTAYMIYIGQLEYTVEDLGWGCLYVLLATFTGSIVSGTEDHEGVQWGTLRCNFTGCCLMAASVMYGGRSGAYLASMSAFQKFVGTFCGGLTAFNGTTSDTVELWRQKKRMEAVYNVIVNLIGMCVVLLVLAYHHKDLAAAVVTAPKETSKLSKIVGFFLGRKKKPALAEL